MAASYIRTTVSQIRIPATVVNDGRTYAAGSPNSIAAGGRPSAFAGGLIARTQRVTKENDRTYYPAMRALARGARFPMVSWR